jgi:hemoglobin
MSRELYVPPGGPPRVERPDPSIYATMGAENVIAMLEDFYLLLGESAIAAMFPQGEEDLREASRKSAAFFIGLLGGPPVYQQLYGNPMMRARHMPFPIDETARLEWMRCFDMALADAPARYNFPVEHLLGFRTFLDGFSSWMVNSAPSE